MIRQQILSCKSWRSLIFSRAYKTNEVRVRFAPSPTGHLHLGGLRTALYNYLFARSKNGKMLLRIEDTDQTRKVEGAMESLIENLSWAGVHCDEGPTQGGPHGPYIQSERCDIYQEKVKQLLSNGSAYKCFCSDKRLDLLRRDYLRNRQIPKYDNRCRHLSDDDAKENIKNGKTYCIRFKLSSDCKYFDDLVYGPIAYDVSLVEGDPVIMKSDGFPTYHFANVVDDHLMEISHVLRGVEWQISTTKHILLYRAFGWQPPQYGHLPLIMNADGTKLSKRQGDIRVQEYRNRGILPAALVNYVTLAGGGFLREQGEGITAMTMQELSEQFRLELVNSHSSRLNPDLLLECNRLELIEQLKNDSFTDGLIKDVQNLVKGQFKDANLQCDSDHVKTALKWSSGRLTSLNDLVSNSLAFIWVLPSNILQLDTSNAAILKSLIVMFQSENVCFERSAIKVTLKEFSSKNDVKFNSLMKLLRGVLSGMEEGPSVAEMIEVLGKEATINRLNFALNAKPNVAVTV